MGVWLTYDFNWRARAVWRGDWYTYRREHGGWGRPVVFAQVRFTNSHGPERWGAPANAPRWSGAVPRDFVRSVPMRGTPPPFRDRRVDEAPRFPGTPLPAGVGPSAPFKPRAAGARRARPARRPLSAAPVARIAFDGRSDWRQIPGLTPREELPFTPDDNPNRIWILLPRPCSNGGTSPSFWPAASWARVCGRFRPRPARGGGRRAPSADEHPASWPRRGLPLRLWGALGVEEELRIPPAAGRQLPQPQHGRRRRHGLSRQKRTDGDPSPGISTR